MNQLNGKRILLGGLLAGLVINISETLLNTLVIGAQFDAAMQRLGLGAPSMSAVGVFIVMGLVEGIMCTWLYAAIRPRYGSGPATAIRAGLFVWFFVSLWSGVSFIVMGMFPAGMLAIVTGWTAIEIPLATVAGAWLYRERGIAGSGT